MNKKGFGWIGAVIVLAAGGVLLFVLLQVQAMFQKTQSQTLKQMQGGRAAQQQAQEPRPSCDDASGVCPLSEFE
ncbi:hypothetical protein [Candidatus Avelusimicrobium aviculae]|uniref:hypothetical protein n=1 Tax=Candidatus Avelusimicrobium aviculae TaxID=3416206 RepID=UPI003D13B90B